MGNGFNVDITGIKEILSQIFQSKPTFPITDKQVLIRALGGETNLVKINEQNETASAVILAESAYTSSQVFHNSNDIIDGIVGGSFTNALTKSKIYNELQELDYPVKHLRDLEKLGVTLKLYGIQWEQVRDRIDLPVSTSAEIVLAISSADPAIVGTDISIIEGLVLPDITQRPVSTPPSAPSEPAAPPPVGSQAAVETPPSPPPTPPQAPPPVPPPPTPPQAPPPVAPPPAPPQAPAGAPGDSVEDGEELKLGFSYLVKEDKPKIVFDAFVSSQKGGYDGLLITRTHPRQVRGKFELGDLKIHWLTDRKSSEEMTLAPALESISYLIEGFVKKHEKVLVLLDGLEYLISVNKFNPVLAFVRRLVDFFSEHDAVFLAPISPMTIGEQEMKTLEREMEPVDEGKSIRLPDGAAAAPGGEIEVGITEQEVPQAPPPQPPPQPPAQPPAGATAPPPVPGTAPDGKGCTPCEGTGSCFWCSGTGKCDSCSGSGMSDTGTTCENCSGSGICDSCKGAKTCVWCKGTGKMVES